MALPTHLPFVSPNLLSLDDWIVEFRRGVATKNSNYFVPLTESNVAATFEALLAALLAEDMVAARAHIAALRAERVFYKLIQLATPSGDRPIYGFLEQTLPGSADYRGWGAVLVRPGGGNKVYQAPHVQADAYTTRITAQAFYTDQGACAAFFAGTHRYANHHPFNADVAHNTTNLFHVLTTSMAQHGQRQGMPFWFIQFHGAADRVGEPAIIGSDGTGCVEMTDTNPLIHIGTSVNRAGYVDMGICGWKGIHPSTAHGRYRLRGTRNLQGRELERLGLRHTFIHLELALNLRAAFYSGADPGYPGMLSLFAALRETLDGAGR